MSRVAHHERVYRLLLKRIREVKHRLDYGWNVDRFQFSFFLTCFSFYWLILQNGIRCWFLLFIEVQLTATRFLTTGHLFWQPNWRFFHDFSIITETFHNEFSSGGLDAKLSSRTANRVSLARCKIDEFNSHLVADHTVSIIFGRTNLSSSFWLLNFKFTLFLFSVWKHWSTETIINQKMFAKCIFYSFSLWF